MALLDEILAHNDHFVIEQTRPITRAPAKKVALFTCMDTRLVEFLEPAMGLRRGDAKVIKSAGNTLAEGGGEVLRSLVVAVYALGCEEIYVIGHLDCGMAHIDEVKLEQKMLDRGVPQEAIDALHEGLHRWLGAFQDLYGNVRRVCQELRESPLIPNDVPVHGLMFDPASGRLEVVINGYNFT